MRHIVIASISLAGGCAVDDLATPTTTSTGQAVVTLAPVLTPQTSGVITRLQSVAPIDDNVAWVSGSAGVILRTLDGGDTWQRLTIPGAETLAFRDIHAETADVAWVLSNNAGANGRIYKTVDGGATWTLQFQSPISDTFYDCFAFWTPERAFAIPDVERGIFEIIRMTDGHTWENISERFPPGVAGEGLFPTDGDCVSTFGPRLGWAAIAGASPSRVIRTTDGGDTWSSHDVPIAGSPTAGAMNVLFRDPRHGILSGGDVTLPTTHHDNFARTRDGGRTWQLATPTPFPGAAYALSYVPKRAHHHVADHDASDCQHGQQQTVVVAGPGGAAWSLDEGDTWRPLPGAGTGYFGVAFASARRGWIAGANGTLARIDF